MLMYGPTRCLPYIDKDTFVIYNLSGMIEGYDSIQSLIPPNELGRMDSYEFDVNYFNYVMYNDPIFLTFFRIIQSLYTGRSVYIISDEADWSENLVESIFKIIQQRYGYNGYCVKTDEDILFALQRDDGYFNPTFGLQNLDQDKLRYQYLVKRMELLNPYSRLEQFYSGPDPVGYSKPKQSNIVEEFTIRDRYYPD